MANPFVHVELHTDDVGRAKEFYSKLFRWELEDVPMPGMTYTLIKPGEGTGGGMMKNPMPGAPAAWLSYVGVDDVEASTKRARELGARIVQDVMPVGDFGKMSVFQDPTGAYLALWQALKKA
jgi:predicted enzyme related to lactoylglutathione lyase